MKLSIIIPYYNTKQYTDKLLDCLAPQITSDVEVILIDDGSQTAYTSEYDWIKIIRKENGGAASARNVGMDNAKGTYIAFIDSDDLVANNYVSSIIQKINEEKFDHCYISWKILPDNNGNYEVKLQDVNSEFPEMNLCVWNRIYKKSTLKGLRFNENKLIAEDAQFIREASKRCKKKSVITDFMYFYRAGRSDGLTSLFINGKLTTQRVVYNYEHITSDMTYLIDEVIRTNKYADVVILTKQNDIPELSDYATVIPPQEICGTEFRGNPTSFFKKLNIPQKTQVVIWTHLTYEIGGIETFIYNFCANLCDKYDIIVLYDTMNIRQIERLKKFVRVQRNDPNHEIYCDTLIVNRVTDMIPPNVKYKRSVQMVHACNIFNIAIPDGRDIYVTVSDEVKNSYGIIAKTIRNVTYNEPTHKVLKLISPTRLTQEKGGERIKQLAYQFKKAKIPFMWFIFTADKFYNDIDELIMMKPTLNIRDYIKDCDYLVQLSDSEGFCYSVIEALELGVPVITTPIPVLKELGVRDEIDGYFVPFDMNDIDVEKIYNNIPVVDFKYDNEASINQWVELLGDSTPLGDYVYKEESNLVAMKITQEYYDLLLQRNVKPGEIVYAPRERAEYISKNKYSVILD